MIFKQLKLVALIAIVAIVLIEKNDAKQLTAKEAIDLLTKNESILGKDRTIELLEILRANQNDEKVAEFIREAIGAEPSELIDFGKSPETCFDQLSEIEDLLQKHQNSLGAYLEKVQVEQWEACDKSLEERLESKLEQLSPETREEARELADYFEGRDGKNPHEDPYTYGHEHIIDDAVRLFQRYLKNEKHNSLDHLFATCHEIFDKFTGILFFLVRSKAKRPLKLNDEQLAFVSVLKICAYPPFDDLDNSAKASVEMWYQDEGVKSWGHGGIAKAIAMLDELSRKLKRFNPDNFDVYGKNEIISEQNVEQAMKDYLKSRDKSKALSRKDKQGDNFNKIIELIEFHCGRFIQFFDVFIYLTETLRLTPGEGRPFPTEVKQVFAYTKVCKSIVTTPEKKINDAQMGRLQEFWAKNKEKGIFKRLIG